MKKFCKKCGCETDRYASGRCKPCRVAQDTAYKSKYPERRKATRAACYAKYADKNKDYSREWREANRERVQELAIAYRAANRDKINKLAAEYRNNNKDKVKETLLKYRSSNLYALRERYRLHAHTRRSRKRENGGVLSNGIVERLLKLQRGKCACCGQPLGDDYHLDHIMPLALGGTNTDDNIQLLRSKCNLSKNAKHPIDFMRQRGFLL